MSLDPTVRHLVIRGRVQGVGYRWSMVGEARRRGVVGWVRNRCDGSVEAVVSGAPAAVDQVIEWARSGPAGARVDAVEVSSTCDAVDITSGFEQRPTV